MKTKLCKYLMAIAAIGFLVTGVSGCTTEKYYDEYIIGSEVITVEVKVNAGDWEWDSENKRFFSTKNVSQINDDSYEYGLINAAIYLFDQGYEVQQQLPTIRYYDEIGKPYLEMISCDIFSGSPSSINFYIQTSDGEETTPYLDEYYFKITILKTYR